MALCKTLTISRNIGRVPIVFLASTPLHLSLELLSVVQVRQKTVRVFFLQLAAFCWIVVVSAQKMNAAEELALNQTLTGLGCWRSTTCKVLNFSCTASGIVRCNSTGSVTYL